MSNFEIYDETLSNWLSFYNKVSLMYSTNVAIKGHHRNVKIFTVDCLVLGRLIVVGEEVLDEKEILAKFRFVLSEALVHEDHWELIIDCEEEKADAKSKKAKQESSVDEKSDRKIATLKIFSPITDVKMFLIGLSKLQPGSYIVKQVGQKMIAMQEIILC